MMIQLLGIVNCFFYLLYTYYCGVVIFKQKTTFHIKYIIAVILFIAGFYLTLYYFSPFFSIFFTYAIYVLFYKIIFHKSWMQTLAGALVVYIIRVFFEFLFILIGWEIKDTVYTCHVYSMPKFYLNLFTCLISFLTVVFLKKYIITLVAFLSKKGTRQVYSFLILCFFTILIILFNSPRLEFNLTLLADFVIAFLLVTFSLINVRQENKTEELNAYYSDLFEYSKLNDTVIKNYKIAHHEHKNQLLIIKGMLKEKREEVEEYIDDLLEENKKVDSNGFAELNYLSIPGVKSFIYYKLDQMKQIGTMIELVISPELADVDLSTIDREQIRELYTILGVILDNIIDALKETEEKLVSIQLYKEDCFIYGEFANSFVGDIDLEKLTVLGYTTKGEQHGVGLCLVDDIIKRSSIYEVRAKIVDQFFVQQVRVDLSKTKKHKK